MSDRPEARILLRQQPGGMVEISVLDPQTGRESRTGLEVPRTHVDSHVRQIKHSLEKAGSWLSSVKWM